MIMLNIKQIADKWGVSTRRISQLCAANQIEGAIKVKGIWQIPDTAQPPSRQRKRMSSDNKSRIVTTKLLPCPVGVTSYKEISTECYYVDKTLLIKDIIDEHSKVMLFTRPRRFGKTLTMDMLKTFFEIAQEDTAVYFNDKKIWQTDPVYQSFQGAYPVIFMSFKDAHQDTWLKMFQSLRLAIKNEYRRHQELLSSDAISETEKNYIQDILEATADEISCQSALGELSYMLSRHYNKKVVIIIDEYDTPIQQGYIHGYYDQVIGFIRNLFSSGFKDNENLEMGILTGILRVAKESLFSGLNNININTILDERYSEYFGFTGEEVTDFAKYYGREDRLNELKSWYDGYCFGNIEIYNPWSVVSYFNNNCIPKAFWSRTSNNYIINKLLQETDSEQKTNLCDLLNDKPVEAIVDTDTIYPEISNSEDNIYSFMLMAGYLKVDSIITEVGDNPLCSLLIPNKEIKSVFKKYIIDSLAKQVGQKLVSQLQIALLKNNAQALQKHLQAFLLETVSSFDTANEGFYHGLTLGLIAIMNDSYHITSNRESGYGRYDILLEPKDKQSVGIILEFKAVKDCSQSQLEQLSKQGLEQIHKKAYFTELKKRNVNHIITYGIAFSGKNVAVYSQEN